MADGAFRFQAGAGQHFYPQFTQSHSRPAQLRPSSPISGLVGLNLDTPSPSRSPGAQTLSTGYNMYTTNSHILNGAGHQRFGVPLNLSKPFQHQNHPHQNQHHAQHQDPSHTTHSAAFSHHQHTHSGGGGISNGAHFSSAHLQNGAPGTIYSSITKPTNEHWNLQLQVAQQERDWTLSHPRARNAQDASRSLLVNSSSTSNVDSEREERQRPGADAAPTKPKDQTWTKLDIGGQTLRQISPQLLQYTFLTELYLNNNRLRILPQEIKQLRSLRVLDLSLNQLRSLPPEIGMLVNLKELLLVDNQLEVLPFEVGNLFQCSMLALEGNPLQEEYKALIVEQGTQELIKTLRENAPRKFYNTSMRD
jgi:CCR4-NOT transcription complex subunit 6